MKGTNWAKDNSIYAIVLVLLLATVWVIYLFQIGSMGVEPAKMYLQALTAVATLALLYYAYFNVASKREEDIARLELAVRPALVWEIESSDGGARLAYKTLKHPIYDFRAVLVLDGKKLEMNDRHLEPAEDHPEFARTLDVIKFIKAGMGKSDMKLLQLNISFHSEVGGSYAFTFTKEVLRKKHGFLFQHRKIVSAKYPWRAEPVRFEE